MDEASGNFEPIGIEDFAEMEAGLVAMARSSVSPSPQIECQRFVLGKADVLVAHVTPLRMMDRPAAVGGKSYLRQSDGDYVMQEHEIRMIEVAKLHADEQVDYDLQPARGRSEADLVPELVSSYLGTARDRDARLRQYGDSDILRMTSVLTAQGEPSLAGLYALGAYPQGHYPGLTVTAAVQLQGGEGLARSRNLEDFTGPVPVLLEEIMDWVRQNLGTLQRYRDDGHLESLTELPLHAVRELIANALVHRDLGPNTLGMGKGIQLRLTPRNLMILSPGGLRGVSLSQLESDDHAQAAVNQRLYQMAKKLKTPDGASIIEGEGGGLREVFRAAQAHQLPRPQLVDTGVQFKALLWRPVEPALSTPVMSEPGPSDTEDEIVPKSSAPTVHEERILATLRDHGPIALKDLAARTGLNSGQVRYALALPLAEGVVAMSGGQGHRSTLYRLGL
ncbi:ATP-binding protein [Rothia halotolerans]|uniref:ATP-binding protein n=1 Tax=Rothia halotolerans TaxID=405770 RepID=UPI001EE053CC|nr:ATP-binding protein [Rothia halotolerans]